MCDWPGMPSILAFNGLLLALIDLIAVNILIRNLKIDFFMTRLLNDWNSLKVITKRERLSLNFDTEFIIWEKWVEILSTVAKYPQFYGIFDSTLEIKRHWIRVQKIWNPELRACHLKGHQTESVSLLNNIWLSLKTVIIF